MATDVAPGAVGSSEGVADRPMRAYRFTVAQFSRIIDAGVFPDGARVELLGGVPVEKMTQNEPHVFAVSELGHRLGLMLPPDWVEREEKPVILGRSWRPEPDIVVARGPRDAYRRRFPAGGDLALLIEVADSSYPEDRGVKWRRYAAAGVPAYGILNIPARRFELYRDPGGKGRSASYRGEASYDEGAEFPVVVDGREVGRIAVKDLLA